MVARARWVLNALLVMVFSVSVACAQSAPARQPFAQQELDQILAPIALYPDALLSQILMAATYPGEIVEAARWSRDNPDLNGDRAVREADRIDWDPSVKSLVAFPQILDMMDAKMNWTEDLGDAFLDQQAQVMDTVQYLRRQAYEAGNLSSNDQFRVDSQDSNFVISYSNPEYAYVPYYDPLVVYGTWWWPAYRPVYWAPWAGYRVRPGYAHGYAWGPSIRLSREFFFGAPDWRSRSVHVVNVNTYYYRAPGVNRAFAAAPGVWQHDATRRNDVTGRDFNRGRNAAAVQGRGAANGAPLMEGRGAENNARIAHDRAAEDGSRGRRGAENAASPVARSQSVQSSRTPDVVRNEQQRNGVSNGQDSREFEGRGEYTRRPDSRSDAGNRTFDRGNRQQITGGMNAPATAPAPAVAPVANNSAHMRSMPVPTSPPPPVVRASNPAPALEASRRTENRPAGGRERSGQPAANADSNGAAAQSNGRGNIADGGNLRHFH